MSWLRREQKAEQFETFLQRLVAATDGMIGEVTPDSALASPTVQAVVTAISRRISITPVHVLQKKTVGEKEIKEKLPNHPVTKLLKQPNDWQSSVDYWADLASALVRHGKFIAVKGQGTTGPIRKLFPMNPSGVVVKQDESTLAVTFQKGTEEWPMKKVHYIRGASRNFYDGDSPVNNIKTAISLEIACEEYGAAFFGNGAMPLMMFKYAQGNKGFKTPEDEKKFIADFQKAFSGGKRHRAMLVPFGLEPETSKVENDKAQFLETRKFYQTVIAGAWGVPPHLVGNLENGTYNNVEQQDKDFTLNVIMPYIKAIESAMERDFLTPADRNNGIVIRFNMDATLRADYLSRMQGYDIQIRNAMKTPNECREREGDNASDDEIADSLFYSANLIRDGELPNNRELPNESDTDDPPTD